MANYGWQWIKYLNNPDIWSLVPQQEDSNFSVPKLAGLPDTAGFDDLVHGPRLHLPHESLQVGVD